MPRGSELLPRGLAVARVCGGLRAVALGRWARGTSDMAGG
jgi:hypothetical protein